MRRLYFPLRSSVELFEDRTSVEASVRAKEGAVLFEEVIFEPGLLIANVGEQGNVVMYKGPDELDEGDLTGARNPAGPGEEFVVSIGTERTPGIPARSMLAVLQTMTLKSYSAEWHTSAIDDLAALGVEWAKLGGLGSEAVQALAQPIGQAERLFGDKAAKTDLAQSHADFVAKSLARDAVTAAGLEASINVTSLFSPLIEEADGAEANGSDALGFLVPNLGQLNWESIAKFREHPGSLEARSKLREFERRALNQEPEDAKDYLDKMKSSITNDLFAALADEEVSVGRAIVEEAAIAAISFVPIVGSIAGPVLGIADLLDDRAAQQQRWYFALMKLRQNG